MARKPKIGAGIALDGEKEFKSAVTGINKDLNVLKSALEKNKSEFEANGKSTQTLKDKLNILSNQYDAQTSKINVLRSALENSEKNYSEYEKRVDQLKNSLYHAEKEMDGMKKSSSITTEELEKQKKEIDQLKQELKKAESTYQTAGNKVKDWQTSLNRAESELYKTQKTINDTEKELKEFSSQTQKAESNLSKTQKTISDTEKELKSFSSETQKAGKAAKEAGEKAESASHHWSKFSSAVGGVTTAMVKVTAAIGTTLAGLGGAAIKVGSDFEAGMSKVEGISKATAEEMERLKEKAKEMGGTTKFSATESAEALQYMAMAGWKTQDMLDGISGVMSLAAASGEELATTADILTDSLTAFGLSAKDAAHFSDVLAMTASSSNTNVAEMGETFKHLAPVAGALGYSVEDAAIAIGLLANSGIKGEKAGTALRATLTNLAKPTNTMAGYMDELNIALTDSQGTMKPLIQLLGEMRESFKGLTEAQQAEYAAGIAGKEAMSGLLAIVNASEKDFSSLTEQIYNCNGAAEQTASTMQDNLKGSVQLLKSAFETLGIEIHESVDTPLKNVVKTANDMVEQLTNALKKGGLSSLVSELGAVFADLVTNIAENAPKMVDAAASLITAFLTGIGENSSKIAEAAIAIGKSLINALVQIIPQVAQVGVQLISAFAAGLFGSNVGEQVAAMGNSIVEAFRSILSAIGKVIEVLKPMMTAFATVLTGVVSVAVQALSKVICILADNIEVFIPLITAAAAAFAAWKTIQTVTGWMQTLSKTMQTTQIAITAFNTANSGMLTSVVSATKAITAKQIAVGVLTGKIKLATAASLAWNTIKLINPWVAIGAAVAGVAAGITALISCLSSEDKKHKELMETIKKEQEAREELHTEQQKSLKTNLTEINRVDELNKELKTLVDTNGKVKAGYEARAKYIMTELNSACGTEMEMVNGVIVGYGKLTDQLSDVLQQNKSWNDELKTLVDTNGKVKQGEEERARVLTENLNQAMKTNYEITDGTISNYGALSESIDTQIVKNQELVQELETLVDQNGKIKEGYKKRFDFIANELKEATGIEIQNNNGIIESYVGIQNEIDKTIEKKKAAIIVESYDDVYKNALENHKKAVSELRTLKAELDALEAQETNWMDTNARRNLEKKIQTTKEAYESQLVVVQGYQKDIAFVEDLQVAHASGTQEDIAKILAYGTATYDENNKLILKSLEDRYADELTALNSYLALYESATTESEKAMYQRQIESSTANIKAIEEEMSAKTEIVESGTSQLLSRQITLIDSSGETFQTSFEELMAKGQQGLKNGEVGVNLAMAENMTSVLSAIINSKTPIEEQTKAIAQLQKQVLENNIPGLESKEKQTMCAILDVIKQTDPEMSGAISSLVNVGVLALENGKLEFTEKAKQLGLDGAQVIKNTRDEFNQAAKWAIQGGGLGVEQNRHLFLNPLTRLMRDGVATAKKELGIQSPSKVFRNLMKELPRGAELGIKDGAHLAINAVSNMAKEMVAAGEKTLDHFSFGNMQNVIQDLQANLNTVNQFQNRIKQTSFRASNTVNGYQLNQTQPPTVVNLYIQEFVNNREGDVQLLAQELDFYARNANLARGVI